MTLLSTLEAGIPPEVTWILTKSGSRGIHSNQLMMKVNRSQYHHHHHHHRAVSSCQCVVCRAVLVNMSFQVTSLVAGPADSVAVERLSIATELVVRSVQCIPGRMTRTLSVFLLHRHFSVFLTRSPPFCCWLLLSLHCSVSV